MQRLFEGGAYSSKYGIGEILSCCNSFVVPTGINHPIDYWHLLRNQIFPDLGTFLRMAFNSAPEKNSKLIDLGIKSYLSVTSPRSISWRSMPHVEKTQDLPFTEVANNFATTVILLINWECECSPIVEFLLTQMKTRVDLLPQGCRHQMLALVSFARQKHHVKYWAKQKITYRLG